MPGTENAGFVPNSGSEVALLSGVRRRRNAFETVPALKVLVLEMRQQIWFQDVTADVCCQTHFVQVRQGQLTKLNDKTSCFFLGSCMLDFLDFLKLLKLLKHVRCRCEILEVLPTTAMPKLQNQGGLRMRIGTSKPYRGSSWEIRTKLFAWCGLWSGLCRAGHCIWLLLKGGSLRFSDIQSISDQSSSESLGLRLMTYQDLRGTSVEQARKYKDLQL